MSRKEGNEYQYASRETTVAGHDFVLREPNWRKCRRAVEIFLGLIGDPEKVLDDVRHYLAVSESGDATEAVFIGLKMNVRPNTVAEVSNDELEELVRLVTDTKVVFDDWCLEDVLSLVAAAGSVLPFGSAFVQTGEMAAAFVSALHGPSTPSATSSETDTDGTPTPSQASESSGASTHVNVPSRGSSAGNADEQPH